MKYFVSLCDPDGRGIPDWVRHAYESLPRSRGFAFQWPTLGQLSVLIAGDDIDGTSMVAKRRDGIAVGTVRLDNRSELERWLTPYSGRELSDLELVLRMVTQFGDKSIPRILGDFAFVIWNPAARAVVAACDAFAVKKLYYTERNGFVAFASRGEALALDDQYDTQYLAERLAACVPSPGLSVYANVKSMPGATLAVLEGARLHTRRYWSAYDFEPESRWATSEREAVECCGQLLADAVRLRLGGHGETWANLSGGMDSSSVVSMAQWLAASGKVADGLAGTITYSDSHGTGADEREYSDLVVRRWSLRNEKILDAPIWYDDRYDPPMTDEPGVGLAFHPRDFRLCEIVRNAGGRILLTGGCGDSLFTGNMFFFADWLTHGRIWPAVREMARRAAMGRASYWELAYRNALLPLLPRAVQVRLIRDAGQLPSWVHSAAVRRYDLRSRASAPVSYAGRLGHKYHDAFAAGVAEIASSLKVGVIEDALDVRHPYLYRPLVEFALRLPPELCARPLARKWVLREAMRGILPDGVRTRVGKGTPHALLAWSLTAQRALLEPLIQNPILADLGVIDAAKFRASFEAARHERDSRDRPSSAVQGVLAIEAWLRMRAGRWPHGGRLGSVASARQSCMPSI